MDDPRLYRALRITTSAVCVAACVLFVALWVRSYWWQDLAHCPLGESTMLLANSRHGVISLSVPVWITDVSGWRVESIPAESAGPPPYSFWYDAVQQGGEISFPHWLPDLLSAVLAAALVVRRPYRFSLRTLLIVMTLVAVVLGLIAAAGR